VNVQQFHWTPPTEDHYSILEATKDFLDNLSECSTISLDCSNPLTQRILEAWERRAEIAPGPLIPDHYNYSPVDVYPPLSYSPIAYEEVDTSVTLSAESSIRVEIPLVTFEIINTINYSDYDEYILPEMYNFPREE